MEIILPKDQKAVHPALIFKNAWGICWKNLGKLGSIYLIFNLPLTIISMFPAVKSLSERESLDWKGVLWFAVMIGVSSWGHVALLLGANKAVLGQDSLISSSIRGARSFLLKYLGVILCIVLFSLGLFVTAGLLALAVLVFLPQISKLLAVVLACGLLVGLVSFLVYYFLRWSLATLTCVLDNQKPLAGLQSSLNLVKKHINPLVGIYGLMGLTYLGCLLPMIIAEVASGRANPAIQSPPLGVTIYVSLLNVALVPFWTTITVLFYKRLKEVN